MNPSATGGHGRLWKSVSYKLWKQRGQYPKFAGAPGEFGLLIVTRMVTRLGGRIGRYLCGMLWRAFIPERCAG